MRKLQSYEQFNEGFKSWISTFLLLANLGMVPPSIKASTEKEKKEFINNLPNDTLVIAKFINFLNGKNIVKNLEEEFKNFKDKGNVRFSDINDKIIKANGKYVIKEKVDKIVDIYNFTPNNYISDFADVISDDIETQLDSKISQYEKKTSIEICILTIDSLQDEIETYSQATFNRLGIGKKENNNGILVVLSIKTRKWRIHTGYGVEGILPDLLCSRFGDNMKPFLKEGDYSGALNNLLEEFKSEINVDVEKFKLEKKQKEERDAIHNKEVMMDTFLWFGISILLIGAIILIVRKWKKDKDLREFKEKFNTLYPKIKEQINKSNTVDKRLLFLFEQMSTILSEIESKTLSDYNSMDWKVSQLLKIGSMFNSLDSYKSKLKGIDDLGNKLPSIKAELEDQIAIANITCDKINKEWAVKLELENPNTADNINYLFTELQKLSGANLFSQYSKILSWIESVQSLPSHYENKERSLVNDYEYANSNKWQIEIERLIIRAKEFDIPTNSYKTKIEAIKSDIKKLNAKSKKANFSDIRNDIEKIINSIKSAISDEEYRIRREEEEAERKSRQSSYSSSSSSSSGSDFGGYSGGSSGGGGASGGW